MKKTKFQSTFAKKDAIAITNIFHPELTDEQLEKIKFGPGSYDWCEIDFSVRGYGKISIGLDNAWQTKLYGPCVSKDDIKKALSDGTISFRCWRFGLDKLSNQEKYGTPERDELERKSREYLEQHYQLQSVDEFYNHYYSD